MIAILPLDVKLWSYCNLNNCIFFILIIILWNHGITIVFCILTSIVRRYGCSRMNLVHGYTVVVLMLLFS